MNTSDEPATRGVAFWVAVLVGWALIAFGIITYANRRGAGDLIPLTKWVIGGNILHDVVLVPVALVVTVLVAHVVREPWRTPLLGALGATACILLVSVPLLGGYGRKPGNPTVLPLDYPSAVGTAIGVVWVLAALRCCTMCIGATHRRRDG